MAPFTAALLTQIQGRSVSVNGTVQVRAGVIRPEIIGPPAGEPDKKTTSADDRPLGPGDGIRIVRGVHFGELGVILSCPAELQRVGSGAWTLVYEVNLSSGERAFLPRANVEVSRTK